MRRWILRAVFVGGALAVVGALAMSSGLVSLSARAGHWAVTEWVLAYAKNRSVATHALGVEVPVELHDPGLIVRGAGHYETGCRWCHGVPGEPMPRVARAMLPPPTHLPSFVIDEPAAQVYRVVHDGIKFTGMPGWPAKGRGDEVWPVVAFVKAMPGMTAQTYWRLVDGGAMASAAAADAPAVVVRACARCHGSDGLGRLAGAFPRLAGQREAYLVAAMRAYAEGARPSGMMQPVAQATSEAEWVAAARYYAGLDGMGPAGEASTLGAQIVREGSVADHIPSCQDCHGPTSHARNPAFPLLAGQDARYLRDQLRLFRDKVRGGSPYAELMEAVRAHELSDAQIEAVSAWYGSVSP